MNRCMMKVVLPPGGRAKVQPMKREVNHLSQREGKTGKRLSTFNRLQIKKENKHLRRKRRMQAKLIFILMQMGLNRLGGLLNSIFRSVM